MDTLEIVARGKCERRSIARTTALVADDHGIFRMALSTILRRDCGFQTVHEVASLDDVVQHLGDHGEITFVTIDLGMPGIDSRASLQSIRQIFPSLAVVIVSASERRQDMLAAVDAGMHGYLPKTLSPSDMALALNRVADGEIYLPWSISLPPPVAESARGIQPPELSMRLTPRQTEVLDLIRAGKSNKEIARALDLTENTIKVHANALFRALGVRDRASAASAQLD